MVVSILALVLAVGWAASICTLGDLTGAGQPGSQPPAGGLFRDTTKTATIAPASRPMIIRSRLVEVDFTQLGRDPSSAADRLILNLFDDTVLVATRDWVESSSSGLGFVWIGHDESLYQSEGTLVIEDDVMIGNVRVGAAWYQIRLAGPGVHRILQVDTTTFPAD
jgi:hypothetical protein